MKQDELARALLPAKQAVEDIMMRRHHDGRHVGVVKPCLRIGAHLGFDARKLDELDQARQRALPGAFQRLGVERVRGAR